VKWGPFFDNTSRTLTYEAVPPVAALGTVTFNGRASFEGASAAIIGSRQMQPTSRLRLPRVASNGELQWELRGELGAQYRVEVSNDLKNWTLWNTFTNITGTASIRDPSFKAVGQRFYRTVRTNQ
jgi:hypothetical protein